MLSQPFFVGASDVDRLPVGGNSGKKHGGCHGSRDGDKALNLAGLPATFGQPGGQGAHVLVRRTGEGAHQVGDDVLFLASLGGFTRKDGQEFLENPIARLAHQRQNMIADMLRRYLELASNEFLKVTGQGVHVVQSEVEPNTTGNSDPSHPWTAANGPEQIEVLGLVHAKMWANFGGHAA